MSKSTTSTLIHAQGYAQELDVSFWDDECGLTLCAIDVGDELVRVYPYNPYHAESGGMEYERVLLSRPRSHVLRYALRSCGLRFYYQRELLPTDLPFQFNQPEHVIGSYAVYHESKSNHELGGTNYGCGKCAHIYRPWAQDSTGLRVWCDIRIHANELTITLPEWFHVSARYPVLVDPTLGYTSIGALNGNEVGFIIGSHFQISANGTATDYNRYIDTLGSSPDITAAIYNSNGTTSSGFTQVGITAGAVVSTGPAWVQESITGSMVSGNYYWLPFASQAAVNCQSYFDSITGNWSFVAQSYTSGSMPDPMVTLTDSTNVVFSTYVNYTTSGGTPLFLVPTPMTGLGIGGPFFRNPIG